MCDFSETTSTKMEPIEDFHLMNLDQRLLKAIAELGWEKPTEIQKTIIPLISEKKSIVVQAKTGSGKTAAFAIPIINSILINKEYEVEQKTKALVITPTKELCYQACRNIRFLSKYTSNNVTCLDISHYTNFDALRPLLAENPDIIVATPAKILSHLRSQYISLKNIEHLVVDEADLIFTFGYEMDMKQLKSFLPKNPIQVTLLSATLDDSTKVLRKCIVKGGEWIRVELNDETFLPSASQLTQYIIRTEEEDKFVILLALLKLKLVRGKTIIFTNSVDRCYKVRLFLEEFGIRSALLNAELPVASRCHTVEQFNRGMYDYLLATDDNSSSANKESSGKSKKSKKGFAPSRSDSEFGVARGIDFQLVSNVLNFDVPIEAYRYVHRVGRTARAGNAGTALTFVSTAEEQRLTSIEQLLTGAEKTEEQKASSTENIFKQYQFRMSEVDGFKYRAQDVLRHITRGLIREARLKEIKSELIKSERLRGYFEDHASDLDALRHDKPLSRNVATHLRDVPDYLVPDSLKALIFSGGNKSVKQNRKWRNRALAIQNTNTTNDNDNDAEPFQESAAATLHTSKKAKKQIQKKSAIKTKRPRAMPPKKRKAQNPLFTFGKKGK